MVVTLAKATELQPQSPFDSLKTGGKHGTENDGHAMQVYSQWQ